MENLKVFFVADKLKSDLRYQIEKGVLKSGDAILSGPKLSKVYKISKMSVDKAIKELVVDNFLCRVPGKGTFVNRSPAIKIHSLGIVGNPEETQFFKNSYHFGVFQGVERVVKDIKGVICYHCKEKEAPYHQLFRNGELVNGMLIFNPEIRAKKELLDLAKRGVPFIVIGNSFKEEEINYVDSNNIEDSAMGVEHLLKLGHRKIGFFSTHVNFLTSFLRLEGYLLALKKHGIKVNQKLICLINDANDSVERLSGCLKEKPTALFISYGFLSEGICRILREAGIKAPNGFSLLTYCDIADSSNFTLPYIGIKQPLKMIGRIATERLLSLIDRKEKGTVKINLRSELIIRS